VVIVVGPVTVYVATGEPPKDTAVAPEKYLPLIVTGVVPPTGPASGVTDDTDGVLS
jgi:hypothetical protein